MNEHVFDAKTWKYGRILHGLGVMLSITVAMITYTCIYAPMVQGTDDTRVEVKRLASVLHNAPSIHKEHKQLRDRLADVSDRIKQLRSRVPEEVMVSQFVSRVTEAAEQEGIMISNIDTGRPIQREGFSEREIEFVGSGCYESFCRFVDRVRKLPRLSKVTGLEIHSEAFEQKIHPMKLRTVIYFGLDAGLLKQEED